MFEMIFDKSSKNSPHVKIDLFCFGQIFSLRYRCLMITLNKSRFQQTLENM